MLNPGELEGFLEGRQGNAIGANNPASDRAEQYELFVRNLLDFDDWRRAQGVMEDDRRSRRWVTTSRRVRGPRNEEHC